jgi:hypothetical protein
MISIQATLTGHNQVVEMIKKAPVRFLITMRGWLAAERVRYVGGPNRNGMFRQQLAKLKLGAGAGSPFNRTGNWAVNVAKSFKGYILNKNDLNNIQLRMGAGLRNPSDFMKGIAMMEEGAKRRSISSSNFMPIPAYKNLKRFGIGIKGNSDETFQNAKLMNIKMTPVMAGNGTMLWFQTDKKRKRSTASGVKGSFPESALLFVGRKRVTLKSKFNFKQQFYAHESAIMARGLKAINRAIRAMNEGYIGTSGNYFSEGSGSGRTVVRNG